MRCVDGRTCVGVFLSRSFFIPYIGALLIVGIPIFILELCVVERGQTARRVAVRHRDRLSVAGFSCRSLGQFSQSGDIVSFDRINKRLRGVGIGSVLGSFTVVAYYSVIVAYVPIRCVSAT